ncbi:hypothetical protein MNB_SV-14-1761 [hydrothermal vent metagenome]|uniref:Chitinase n=1 Tax=hydrothermal vent metagenome TaxID=652676 RepID=A0A1W1C0F9_9ZZZZ
MKKKIWLLSIIGIALLFSACGSSSKKAKVLQQKMINLVGIPQNIVANICQDNNKNGSCDATELQAKVSFSQGDSMQTIWSKLTLTQEGRYLLETYDPSKPLLLELKDEKSQHFTDTFTLPFDGLKENEDKKELSILQAMIDKDVLTPQNVNSARVMKNVDDFYKTLLSDLEENIKILKNKGLTTKQAVAGNINEIAEELITNGIENTIPAKMNSCNGDKTCIDGVLNRLSTELVLTDEEANTIAGNSEGNEDNQGVDNNPNKGKIDIAEYLPSNSVTKTFITKEKYYSQEEESVSTYTETISRKDNVLKYNYDNNNNTIVTINRDNLLVEWKDIDSAKKIEYKMNRYVNIGDTIGEWKDNYKDSGENYTTNSSIEYTCKLDDILNSFSHGGYNYNGSIIKEKCFMNTTTNYTYENNIQNTIKSSTITYEYFQQNIGDIASINDICYDERGIEQTTEGCTPNGYDYNYLEE